MKRNNAILIGALITLFMLIGCQREWHLEVIDISDIRYPSMRVYTRSLFGKHGIGFAFLTIEEIDKKVQRIRFMWDIERISDAEIFEFKYGIVPAVYRERIKPEPLEVGKYYRINGSQIVFIDKTEFGIKPRIYTLNEFYKQIVNQ